MAKQVIVADDEKKEVKRRPVGPDGTFLKSDSGDTSGVSWDTPSSGITGETIRKNSGANVGTRPRLNLIEGSNITLTVADDGVDNEVDITIAATASTSGHTIKDEGTPLTQRAGLNFVGDSVVATDDAGNNETDVTVNHLASAVHSAAQPVTVRKNSGADVGTRPRINLIEGSNVTLTVADDGGSNEVDVTIASTGGGSGISPLLKTAVRNGLGNITTNSTTRTPIDSTNLPFLTFNMSVGDTVKLALTCSAMNNSAAFLTSFDFEVDQPTSANTYIGVSNDQGVAVDQQEVASRFHPRAIEAVFTATESGTHGFRPVWFVESTSTGTILNAASGTSDCLVTFMAEYWPASASGDGLRTLNGLRIRRAATQNINNTTSTLISFDTEDEDSSGYFAPTSTTVTIPTGEHGIYAISAGIVFPGATMTGRCFMNITAGGKSWRADFGANEDTVGLGITVRLADADTITVTVFQTSGGTQTVTAELQMWKVGL